MDDYFIKSSTVMDSFYFEERLKKYLELSSKEKSARILLFELISFLKELVSQENDLLKEVYVLETISDLVPLLEIYSAHGVEPNKTNNLLETAIKLSPFINDEDSKFKIEKQIQRIKEELEWLELILDGKGIQHEISRFSFPVLERTSNNSEAYGMIEQFEISIHTNKNNHKLEFNLIPSLPKIDEKLQKQIDNSWRYAVKFVKRKTKKIKTNLEVTVRFVHKLGIYEGDSLGVALTIGFIQELFKYYDIREKISFENNIIATGSMNEEGEIGAVGEEIIKSKVEPSFYSLDEIFLVPQKDLEFADKKLKVLQANYPKRKLRVIAINIIEDVISRRDVLNIEKQNIVLWGSKKVIKNKLSLALLILFMGTLLGFYYVNQDNNPHHVDFTSNSIEIKNKYNKILWGRKVGFNSTDYPDHWLKSRYNILDVNDDGINEVLLVGNSNRILYLLDNIGDTIWQYEFHYKKLKTENEIFTDNYTAPNLMGITKIKNRKTIIGFCQHIPYYPTAIVQIDLQTGKRINDIFWHSGGVIEGKIADIENDGKSEIICSAINNGLGRAVLFSLDIDKLNGQSLSENRFTFQNIKQANFNRYILLPAPDYFRHEFPKYFKPAGVILNQKTKEITVGIISQKVIKDDEIKISILFDFNYKPKQIVPYDLFSVERDKLVKKGILNYPLTDTDEYRQILLHQIEYWDGEKFVKFSYP